MTIAVRSFTAEFHRSWVFVRIPGIGEGVFGGQFPGWSWWSEVTAADARLRASWAAEAA